MFHIPSSKFHDNGFTLIGGLVGIAIFSIVFLALISVFSAAFNTIKDNRAKVTANSIALEQLEIIRGMDFEKVKTVNGWSPPGDIPNERILSRAGFEFTILTDIAFVDDPFDGTDGGSPNDLFPYDYKKARVRVRWTNPLTGGQEEVAMTTNVVPPGLEGGTGLYVTVFNASGQPVNEAKVDVTSVAAGYTLSDALTDLNGNLWIGGLDPAGDYHIVATKDGYSAAQTYAVNNNPASPNYNPNPTKPDAIVIDGEVTRVGLAIDVLGSLNIQTVNYDNPQNWRVNTDSGSDNQTDVGMAIDDSDNLYFVWVNDTGSIKRIYAQKYDLSQHNQWAAGDVQLTVSNNQVNPRIAIAPAVDGDYFYLIWNDDRIGNQNTYLQKFKTDNGSSVWGDIKVNIDANDADQINPDLAIDSLGNIYAVWTDNRSGSNWDIYAQKYDKTGTRAADGKWAGGDLKINADSGVADQKNPRIVIDNEDNFYVVWEDETNGDWDIFMAKFDGNGNTLFAGKKVNTDNSFLDQYEPAIAYDGGDYLYLCWSDKRNSEPDIYAQKYDKTGTRAADGEWGSGDVIINDDSTPDAWRTKPSVAYSSDSAIYFSWQDDKNGNDDVYSTKFDSDGNRLWTYDLIMNGSSSEIQGVPGVIADSMGYGITAWEDFKNGDADIYAARYNNLGFFTRTNVPITITGVKLKGTYPNDSPPPDDLPIYKYDKNFVSDGGGNISIGDGVNEIEWDNYSFVAGGGYSIVSTDQPEPLFVAPGSVENVVINVEP